MPVDDAGHVQARPDACWHCGGRILILDPGRGADDCESRGREGRAAGYAFDAVEGPWYVAMVAMVATVAAVAAGSGPAVVALWAAAGTPNFAIATDGNVAAVAADLGYTLEGAVSGSVTGILGVFDAGLYEPAGALADAVCAGATRRANRMAAGGSNCCGGIVETQRGHWGVVAPFTEAELYTARDGDGRVRLACIARKLK